MKLTRKSIISGIERTKELDVTIEQLQSWENGTLAQNAFPNLSDTEREFIMTGIVDEEWEDLMDEDE